MLQRIRAYAVQNHMFDGVDKVVVGLSGGADSVCLLLALEKLQPEFGYELMAVHVNHKIRGAEADRDENFCRKLCEEKNIIFQVVTRNVPDYASKNHMTLEEAGRILRYEAFASAIEGYVGKIAVAHHKNDNAETVLFNMARGSALSGLVGIRPVNNDIIRPLLCVNRKEIEEFLAECGQDYCTDSTNADNDYSRNIIRNELLPKLSMVNAGCIDNIDELSNYMARVEKYIARESQAVLAKTVEFHDNTAKINGAKLRKFDPLIQENVLYSVICQCSGRKKDIERVHVEYLSELMGNASGKQINLPYGLVAKKEYDTILVGTELKACEYDWELYTFTEKSAYEEFVNDMGRKCPEKKFCTIEIDYDTINSGLILRKRQPKDYMVIDRQGRRKAVSRIFIDDKIPKAMRDMPIVFDGDEAVWLRGRRVSPRYAVRENTVNRLIVLVAGDEPIY